MRQSHHRLHQLVANACQRSVHCVQYPFSRSSYRSLAIPLPEIPIAAFKTCTASGPPHLQITLQAISVVFGGLFSLLVATVNRSRCAISDISAFSIIIFSASFGAVNVRFSSILRTILADATVHFIMAMILQTLVLLFMSLADVRRCPPPILVLLTHSPLDYNEPIPSYVRIPPPPA